MFDSWVGRHQFEQALKDVFAKLRREGIDRVDRVRLEEVGQRFGVDPDEVYEAVAVSRGDLWEGEFVETDEKPGWEVIVLKDVPSSGPPSNRGV